MAIIKREVQDEDWKTAIAQHKKPIPAGAKVKVIEKIENVYGSFYVVEYEGTRYNVKPKDIDLQCFGKMFREDGRLTYGAMICEECEEVELCRKHSENRGK